MLNRFFDCFIGLILGIFYIFMIIGILSVQLLHKIYFNIKTFIYFVGSLLYEFSIKILKFIKYILILFISIIFCTLFTIGIFSIINLIGLVFLIISAFYFNLNISIEWLCNIVNKWDLFTIGFMPGFLFIMASLILYELIKFSKYLYVNCCSFNLKERMNIAKKHKFYFKSR